jgi:hypothetical protein
MGEAYYTLTGIFKTNKEAKDVEIKLRPLLDSLIELNDTWQSNRGSDVSEQMKILQQIYAWKELDMDKFIVVDKSDKGTNFLAGPLPDMSNDYNLSVNKLTLKLGCTVWHFTEWESLVAWLTKQGARNARYVSDEW